jgi:hypothetical protein
MERKEPYMWEKHLNGELAELSLPKTENKELHNQQSKVATMEQC